MKLGYEAKSPPPVSTKPAGTKQLKQLPIPPNAPQFFIDAVERAKKKHRPIVIDFWAEWCVTCLRLKRETLEHPDVANALRSVELIYVDLDKYPALGDVYGVAAIPDLIFADKTGRIVDRLQNFESPEALISRVQELFGRP